MQEQLQPRHHADYDRDDNAHVAMKIPADVEVVGKKGGYLIPLTEILISLTLISSDEKAATETFSSLGSLASHWQHCFSHTYWLATSIQSISDRELMVGHSRSL